MRAGELLAGRYRLDARLGAGAMGEVWRAHDERLGRDVAVKIVGIGADADATARDRVTRESLAAARLNHPNIVAVYDGGTQDDSAYIVMQLVNGETVADKLQRGPLPMVQAVDIARQVALALRATHAVGIVHRDIKPGNVMMDGDTAKVLDFGIARLASETATLTAPATVLGTAAYMSPEQAQGFPTGPASDIYSLGCLIVAMVTGRPPFSGGGALAVARRQVVEEAPRLASLVPGTPPALDALVAAMLAKNPAARPDASQAAGELARIRDGLVTGNAWGEDRTVVMGQPPIDPSRTAVMPNQTAVMPPQAQAFTRPPSAVRTDAVGASADGSSGARGHNHLGRAAKVIIAAMVALIVIALAWSFGSRLVNSWTNGRSTPAVATTSAQPKPTKATKSATPTQASSTGAPGVQLPSVSLPTVSLPSMPAGAKDTALSAALQGVSTSLDSWSPKNDAESTSKAQLQDQWATTSDKVAAGKNGKQAMASFRKAVEKSYAAGTMPAGTHTGLLVSMGAVDALV